MHRLLTFAAVGSISLCASAQTLVRSVNGPVAGCAFGKACLRIDDQNGDGIDDLLVGAPGFAGLGAVFCISGAFPAIGASTPIWAAAPPGNLGDQFGYAIADIGDVTGDGVTDYLVGQPGYDVVGDNDVGCVRLLDGATHSVVSQIVGGITPNNFGPFAMFGSSIAACGDINGDGYLEVAIGAPGSAQCYVRVLEGSLMWASGSSLAGQYVTFSGNGGGSNAGMGTAIVSGFDLNGNGIQELAFSTPGFDGAFGADSGLFEIHEVSSPGFPFVAIYASTIGFERLGQALDAKHDYDGDGVVDIVAGAPNSPDLSGHQGGRVVVLSGARLAAGTAPYEVYTLMPGVVSHVGQLTFDTHFGATVCGSRDLNDDGVGEILVGSPDYFTGFGAAKGVMTIVSGASGTRWTHIFGSGDDHLGSSITGAIEDLDGDGFRELVVAGSLSDLGGTDSGVVKCYSLFPIAPATYCTAKVNSLGCSPWISFSGSPKASIPTGTFTVTAANFVNQKSGLLFYSHAPNAAPFQGGTLCVKPPLKRTGPMNSGGSASGADCSGAYSLDFNARIQSGIDPSLVAGAEIYSQYWARDPASPSTTSLSNALRFLIHP